MLWSDFGCGYPLGVAITTKAYYWRDAASLGDSTSSSLKTAATSPYCLARRTHEVCIFFAVVKSRNIIYTPQYPWKVRDGCHSYLRPIHRVVDWSRYRCGNLHDNFTDWMGGGCYQSTFYGYLPIQRKWKLQHNLEPSSRLLRQATTLSPDICRRGERINGKRTNTVGSSTTRIH